ncbi:hypothetical protein GCM10027180_23870 [Microbulbifer echini]
MLEKLGPIDRTQSRTRLATAIINSALCRATLKHGNDCITANHSSLWHEQRVQSLKQLVSALNPNDKQDAGLCP